METGKLVELAMDIPELGWKEGQRVIITQVRGFAPAIVADVINAETHGTLTNVILPFFRDVTAK